MPRTSPLINRTNQGSPHRRGLAPLLPTIRWPHNTSNSNKCLTGPSRVLSPIRFSRAFFQVTGRSRALPCPWGSSPYNVTPLRCPPLQCSSASHPLRVYACLRAFLFRDRSPWACFRNVRFLPRLWHCWPCWRCRFHLAPRPRFRHMWTIYRNPVIVCTCPVALLHYYMLIRDFYSSSTNGCRWSRQRGEARYRHFPDCRQRHQRQSQQAGRSRRQL